MKRNFFIVIFSVIVLFFFPAINYLSAQRVRNIDYVADYIEGVRLPSGEEIQKLIDNVVFQDSSTTMYCDSAYFYKNHDIDAYGSIRIYPDRGNTKLTGKVLNYRAENRIANINEDVILVDNNTTLKTQSIFYDLRSGVAYYPLKGTITSEENTIVSNRGSYDNHTKISYFKDNVIVTNPSYLIHTDTMIYNTTSKIVEFVGPTLITSEKDSIYCEKGWYNTTNDISSFRQNAWLKGDGRVIKGDTLYYEKHTGYGIGYGNVELWDTTQNVIIRGNYATVNRPLQVAVVTKKALMIQVDNNDSLYMHADTIRTGIFTVKRKPDANKSVSEKIKGDTLLAETQVADTLVADKSDTTEFVIDTLNTDTLVAEKLVADTLSLDTLNARIFISDTLAVVDTFKFVKAYYHVKFYRSDLQGKCDSMYYSFRDSTLEFFREPVLWTGGTQLTANHVKVFIVNQKMDRMEMTGTSFIASQQDSTHYNQIKGRNMTGYFFGNELYKMIVKGNGQSIYFPIDQGEISATNKNESTDIILFFKDRQLDRITYINSINGVMHPPAELSGNDLFLKDFKWYDDVRPKKWYDIFIW